MLYNNFTLLLFPHVTSDNHLGFSPCPRYGSCSGMDGNKVSRGQQHLQALDLVSLRASV